MKTVWVVVVAVATGALSTGCGERKGQSSNTGAQVTQVADMPPLPEWAPENPSPEFLRAARLLKPIPPEILGSFGEKAGPAVQAILAQHTRTYAPAWEFFGTLSDEEIEHLRSSGTVRVSFRSMPDSQRRILDGYFEAWRKAMAGQQQLFPDWLVELYREGAKEDLSNVDAGFRRDSDHGVNIQFWITQPDGGLRTPSSTVAFM